MVVDTGKIPYPKSVFFIITNEFCERFSYYGMKAVLTIYLKNVLGYTEDKATVVYHVFSMLCYFTPVFGAMLADSLLGKFKTIFYLSIVYAIGNVVLSLAATTPLQLPIEAFSIIGLLLIAIGTGGIKPCVSAFGGDQFVLPQQATQLASFFSIFYFSINAGSLLSTFITPIFRKDVRCFGGDTCYPLAFGVPAVLMIVSLLVFLVGYRWYTIRKPDGNITIDVCKCISTAVREKTKSHTKKDHWLDYASTMYDFELINSVKQLLKVLLLYIPLPVFWALFDQQGSRWTFQATRMDGELFGWTIKPDQMQVLNPFLILAFIPIFDQGIYPAFDKIGLLRKPLQRLTVGGILAGVAFVISGFLEISLESTYAVKLAGNEAHLNFINDLNCSMNLQIGENPSVEIDAMGQYIIKQIKAGEYQGKVLAKGDNEECKNLGSKPFTIAPKGKEARSYFISSDGSGLTFREATNKDILEKNGEGAALLKFIFIGFKDDGKQFVRLLQTSSNKTLSIYEEHAPSEEMQHESGHQPKASYALPLPDFDSAVYRADPMTQTIQLFTQPNEVQDKSSSTTNIGTIKPRQGGNYLYIVKKDGANQYSIKEHIITQPNSIHILWLVPQYVVITVAEVMFSVTGLQFAFSQAPASMKSVLQAAWLLTVAFGNVIVVFLAEFKIFDEQWKEFFLYAGLMFVDMVIFAVLAWFYVPIQHSEKQDEVSSPNTVEMRENKRSDTDYNNP